MSTYISVPVPQQLVPEVMKLITDWLAGASPQTVEEPLVGDPLGLGDRDRNRMWTRGQFAELFDSQAPSVRLFGDVLRVLAERSPSFITRDELAQEVGVTDGLTMVKKFGPVTRWMRKRWGDDALWPIVWSEQTLAMNSHNATICLEVSNVQKEATK